MNNRSGFEDVWRRGTPHVLAALLRRHRDLRDCEDAVQEALLWGVVCQWPTEGVPDNPRWAWLVRVASRRVIDQARAGLACAERGAANACERRSVTTGVLRPPMPCRRARTTRCTCSCCAATRR